MKILVGCIGTLVIMAAPPPSWIAVFALGEFWALVFARTHHEEES